MNEKLLRKRHKSVSEKFGILEPVVVVGCSAPSKLNSVMYIRLLVLF